MPTAPEPQRTRATRPPEADLVKAALLLDSLAPGVVRGLREILTVREKGETHYIDLPDYVASLEPAQLAESVRELSPAEQAAVLRVLPPDPGAAFLACFDDAAIGRIAAATTSLDAFQALRTLRTIERRLLVARVRREIASGPEALVAVLSRADDRVATSALAGLQETSPETAAHIRERVFTSADVVRLPDRDLAELLHRVDEVLLGKALVGAPEPFRRKVVANLSRGRREVVDKETEFARRLPPPELARARRAFLDELVARFEDPARRSGEA